MNKELDAILNDAKSLQVQGATTVAKTIVGLLIKEKDEIADRSSNKDDFIAEIKNIAKKLSVAQPTETMTQNILGFIIFELQDPKLDSLEDCKCVFDKVVNNIKNTIEKNEESFIENGLGLIKSMVKKSRALNVLTHCHSSGVREILKRADEEGIVFRVFSTETRPVFLGRVAANEMVKDNLDVTMIIDSAAPFVMSSRTRMEFGVDLVLLGSDAITINGEAANKIGSYGISLSAFYQKIPFYIVTSLLKTKKGVYNILDIPMKIRPCKEVWQEAPKDLNIVNFAFDIIPAEFITGFITEFGILKPEEIRNAVAENYPRLL